MVKARILLVAMALLLAACGGDKVRGIPAGFGDSEPHAWGRHAPDDHAVHGIDVSRWQGTIDWNRVAASGVAFAFIKATDGGDVTDPMFLQNWNGARRAGVSRGAYHFYYLCRPAHQQADWFIQNVPRQNGALPPVLDIEWNHQSRTCRHRPDPATIRAEILSYQAIVGAAFGQRPVIYTTVDFFHDNDLGRLRGEEFWLRSVAGHPGDVFPGQRWTFWQYTGTGIVPGISGDVDINAYTGSKRSWYAWRGRRQM